jgi:ornithine decarboxylase
MNATVATEERAAAITQFVRGDQQREPSVDQLLQTLETRVPATIRFPQQDLPTPPRTAAPRIYDPNCEALAPVSDAPVADVLRQVISTRLDPESDTEAAFFAADLSAVYEAVQMWRESAVGSRVEIFYAVKCNPSPPVLHLLSLLGISFDCASAAEINAVLSLPSAPSPSRIIFANPCKPASHIRTAAQQNVSMMTFDNSDELYKIKRIHPGAKLVLRMLTDDSKSLCRLGLKFGAPLDTCPALFKLAKELGLDVVGVSFHVGSGCKDPAQFADAVWRAKRVFMMGEQAGFKFNLLDVGGGFEREQFGAMSQVLRESLDLYFPEDEGVRIIAEPGRLLVSSGKQRRWIRPVHCLTILKPSHSRHRLLQDGGP